MRMLTVLMAAAIVMAGCGGGEEKPAAATSTPQPEMSSSAAMAMDARAKSDARNAVAELESCFVTVQDYRQCKRVPAGIEVEATLSRFTLSARSESGATFRIARGADYALTRTCEPAGSGGCAADGTW